MFDSAGRVQEQCLNGTLLARGAYDDYGRVVAAQVQGDGARCACPESTGSDTCQVSGWASATRVSSSMPR